MVNNTDKRFLEYFQIQYNFDTEKWTFAYRRTETGKSTIIGIKHGTESTLLEIGSFESLNNIAYEIDTDFASKNLNIDIPVELDDDLDIDVEEPDIDVEPHYKKPFNPFTKKPKKPNKPIHKKIIDVEDFETDKWILKYQDENIKVLKKKV